MSNKFMWEIGDIEVLESPMQKNYDEIVETIQNLRAMKTRLRNEAESSLDGLTSKRLLDEVKSLALIIDNLDIARDRIKKGLEK